MNNDIVTKARLNAALGTEGNMGFEHNDIVTVDKMNEAIAEGGGGSSDFSTAEVTIIATEWNGSIYGSWLNTWDNEGGAGGKMLYRVQARPRHTITETLVLYDGQSYVHGTDDTAPISITGDAEDQEYGDVIITGDCTLTYA